MKAIIKWLLSLSAVFCIGAGLGLGAPEAIAEGGAKTPINATVTEINSENLDGGRSFVMVLSANDYMTAEGWTHQNYMWLNAEGVNTFEGRKDIDLKANNVANAELDQNLDKYNFEDYIFLDGVSLAEFSKTNGYTMFANKRTRPNTLSIDFQPNVLRGVDVIEIKAGCQLPTLTYSYLGEGEFSCIEIQESVSFENNNGAWPRYFAGYEEGVEYEAGKDYVELSLQSSYKGHTAVLLDSYTDFFKNNAVQGEKLQMTALVSTANTKKGHLMVLNFVHPIDVADFNRLHLRVYINHQIDVLTYNAHSITEESLGTALESFTVGGGQFISLTLNTALYANDSGKVETLVFQFVNDCMPQYDGAGNPLIDGSGEKIRDTFFFVSFRLENVKEGGLVTKDSLMIVEDGDNYALTFRFNALGVAAQMPLDGKKVSVNGHLLSTLLEECSDASAKWYCANGIYQINLSIPKSYTGKAQIKNADYGFAGNNMSVLAGLTFPNGDVLKQSYTCHLYPGENILDSDLVENYQKVQVERVLFSYVDGTNLNFSIYFTAPITASLYNHACEHEDWRSSDDVKEIISYDKGGSDIFVAGGYKSSLLDHVVINGRTIGEWHAYDPAALTCVQVHYGIGLELNRMDVRFESVTKSTYDQLCDLVKAGNGVSIEILEGLKFMTNAATDRTQLFRMVDGTFKLQEEEKEIHVYYNGSEVQEGQLVTVQTAVSDASIAVEGINDYTITRKDEDGKKTYIITYGKDKTFTFAVKEEIVVLTQESEKSGCSSYLGGCVSAALALCVAVAWKMKGGRKHEED